MLHYRKRLIALESSDRPHCEHNNTLSLDEQEQSSTIRRFLVELDQLAEIKKCIFSTDVPLDGLKSQRC